MKQKPTSGADKHGNRSRRRNPIFWLVAFIGFSFVLAIFVGDGKGGNSIPYPDKQRDGQRDTDPDKQRDGQRDLGPDKQRDGQRETSIPRDPDALPLIPNGWGTPETRRVYADALLRWKGAWNRMVSVTKDEWRQANERVDRYWPFGQQPSPADDDDVR